MSEMSEAKTHTGGCHCGKIRYEVTTDLAKVIECNCSICAKKGHLLCFVPADQFRLLSGDGEATDYQFNKKHIHHLFCPTCGVQSYASGTMPSGAQMVGVNVRCLDGIDLSSLKPTPFDGKKL